MARQGRTFHPEPINPSVLVCQSTHRSPAVWTDVDFDVVVQYARYDMSARNRQARFGEYSPYGVVSFAPSFQYLNYTTPASAVYELVLHTTICLRATQYRTFTKESHPIKVVGNCNYRQWMSFSLSQSKNNNDGNQRDAAARHYVELVRDITTPGDTTTFLDETDVIGRLVEIYSPQEKVIAEKMSRLIDFVLEDNSKRQVKFTLWDDHVDQLSPYFNSVGKDPVILLIQMCSVKFMDTIPVIGHP